MHLQLSGSAVALTEHIGESVHWYCKVCLSVAAIVAERLKPNSAHSCQAQQHLPCPNHLSKPGFCITRAHVP